MTIRMNSTPVTWFLVIALTVCPLHAAADQAGTRYLLFFDLSSVAEDDGSRWLALLESRVINRFRPGDALTIYPIHDRTLGAGAIFTGAVAALPPDPGMAATAETARTVARVRTGAKTALRRALAERFAATKQSDVLSVLDRYEADVTGRRMVVVLFSDLLHVGADLDLERTRLDPDSTAGLLKTLARQRHWRSDQLTGVVVHCVLNAESADHKPGPNNRRVLKDFYEALFSAVGARLVRFETDLDLTGL